MTIATILETKRRTGDGTRADMVLSLHPDASVADAVAMLAEQRIGADPRGLRTFRGDDEIDQPIGERWQGIEAGADAQVELDLRMAGAVGVQRRHQPVEAGVAFQAQQQAAGRAATQPLEILVEGRQQRQHGIRRRHQPASRHRQLLRPAVAAQQRQKKQG